MFQLPFFLNHTVTILGGVLISVGTTFFLFYHIIILLPIVRTNRLITLLFAHLCTLLAAILAVLTVTLLSRYSPGHGLFWHYFSAPLNLLSVFSFYILCESLPKQKPEMLVRVRIIVTAVLGCIALVCFFSPDWVQHEMIEGTHSIRYGSLYGLAGMSTIAIGAFACWAVFARMRQASDATTRFRMKLVLLTAGTATAFALFPWAFRPKAVEWLLGANAVALSIGSVMFVTVRGEPSVTFSAPLRFSGHAAVVSYAGAAAMVFATIPGAFDTPLNILASSAAVLGFVFVYLYVISSRFRILFFSKDRKFLRLLSKLTSDVLYLNNREADSKSLARRSIGDLRAVVDFQYAHVITARDGFSFAMPASGGLPVERKSPRKLGVVRRLFNARLKLPDLVLRGNTGTFVLTKGVHPLAEDRNFRRKYPRFSTAVLNALEEFRNAEIEVVMPLVDQDQIFGIILLGPKKNQDPIFASEVAMLEALRPALAHVFRLNMLKGERRRSSPTEKNDDVALEVFEETSAGKIQELKEHSFVYESRLMEDLLNHTREIADLEMPVLITGETGTGKELIARVLHENSQRQDQPFVAFNCASIPVPLWESTIFGHSMGAFTDARSSQPGLIEVAGDGTLFLDEIGEMALEAQGKMLRLLQERNYYPVGGKKLRNAGCRFVFATHRNLPDRIGSGDFREDLYHRMNVFPLHLPPLRERKKDIPFLVKYMIARHGEQFQTPVHSLAGDALAALCAYSWPGNVRELENCLIRTMARVKGGTIARSDLPAFLTEQSRPGPGPRSAPAGIPESEGFEFNALMDEYARSIIERALRKTRGNQTQAAELLGISRGKLKYQIKELDI